MIYNLMIPQNLSKLRLIKMQRDYSFLCHMLTKPQKMIISRPISYVKENGYKYLIMNQRI